LYFCEDGGDACGVHGRDASGRFFTIFQDATGLFSGETTGLAFSPNGKYMYVSFQSPGIIFEISRTDGLPFYGSTLDIKYHGTGDGTNSFRQLYEDQ
jgi:secreted PhoX family phosphatase